MTREIVEAKLAEDFEILIYFNLLYVRFRFVELFLLDSIVIENGSLIFSLASPKLPPNFLIIASGKIRPVIPDSDEQMFFTGVSIETTFALPHTRATTY